MSNCQICNQPLAEKSVTTTTLVCKNQHGGASPQIGSAVSLCPAQIKGSIWAHVIDDAGNEVPNIPATLAGVETVTKEGFASSGPLSEDKKYLVTIGKLPEIYLPLAVTTAENVPVKPGEITRVRFQLIRAAKMTVTVKFADPDGVGIVPGVQVHVSGSGDAPPDQPTLGNGSKDFEKLHPGPHEVSIAFDQEKYWIEPGKEKQLWDVKPDDPNNVVFTLTPLVWIKVAIVGQVTDPVKPKGKLKLKKLDATEETKDFPDSTAVDFPKLKKLAGTCSVEEVNVEGDELYEVVKVSEA